VRICLWQIRTEQSEEILQKGFWWGAWATPLRARNPYKMLTLAGDQSANLDTKIPRLGIAKPWDFFCRAWYAQRRM